MPDHQEQDNTQQQPFVGNSLSFEATFRDPKLFVAHLREEMRQATRVVMEENMREELNHFVGAEWGESTLNRTGYRDGTSAKVRVIASKSGWSKNDASESPRCLTLM